jgi:hypothetical protein
MFICPETLSHQGPGSLPRSNCFCRWLVRCVLDPGETCSSVGGIGRLPHQVQAAGHLHSSQWRPK